MTSPPLAVEIPTDFARQSDVVWDDSAGTWANTARDSFAIQPGETLNYVTAWDVTQQQLDAVVALYSSPDIGSLVAAWPTTEQLAFCRLPLPNAGSGTDFPY